MNKTFKPTTVPAILLDKPNGGFKYDDDKPRFDLLPASALIEIAKVSAMGAKKYAPRNWEKGMDWGRFYAAAQRHLWAFWDHEEIDPESGLSHLAHAAWNIMALYETTKKYPGLDDRCLGVANGAQKNS